eukprot:COSAG02_NODE_146_length_33985_cov_263.461695_8_plen_106_part_00
MNFAKSSAFGDECAPCASGGHSGPPYASGTAVALIDSMTKESSPTITTSYDPLKFRLWRRILATTCFHTPLKPISCCINVDSGPGPKAVWDKGVPQHHQQLGCPR